MTVRVWWRMAINYDKLLALKIPDAEHTYTERTRCSTRSASASATIRLDGATRFRL